MSQQGGTTPLASSRSLQTNCAQQLNVGWGKRLDNTVLEHHIRSFALLQIVFASPLKSEFLSEAQAQNWHGQNLTTTIHSLEAHDVSAPASNGRV
jgi:hypothetical protein